jgi:hypothetical protein
LAAETIEKNIKTVHFSECLSVQIYSQSIKRDIRHKSLSLYDVLMKNGREKQNKAKEPCSEVLLSQTTAV